MEEVRDEAMRVLVKDMDEFVRWWGERREWGTVGIVRAVRIARGIMILRMVRLPASIRFCKACNR